MTYERQSIQSWIAQRRDERATCPVTRQQMGTLVSNRAVRDAVEQCFASKYFFHFRFHLTYTRSSLVRTLRLEQLDDVRVAGPQRH